MWTMLEFTRRLFAVLEESGTDTVSYFCGKWNCILCDDVSVSLPEVMARSQVGGAPNMKRNTSITEHGRLRQNRIERPCGAQ